MARTADEIAVMYLGGDAARADLMNHILEYGEALALAAAAAEREACAKIADAQAEAWGDTPSGEAPHPSDIAERIADAIRSRT